jgi:hypothetical protein
MSFKNGKPFRLPVIAGVAALMVLALAATATALVRPQGATPIGASAVIAYDACTVVGGSPPGQEHNPANLAGDACAPPVRSSPWTTAGEPPGAPANFKGNVKLVVCTTAAQCSAGGGSGTEDVLFPSGAPAGNYLQDARCANPGGMTNGTVCVNPNAAQGPDFGTTNAATPALLKAASIIRITDRNTGPTGGPYTTEGTTKDLEFAVPLLCSVTGATTIGGSCLPARASANAACGGCVGVAKLSNIQVPTIEVREGGPDGTPFDANPSFQYATQGLFIP